MKCQLTNSLHWSIYIINTTDKTKLSCLLPHQGSMYCSFFWNLPPLFISTQSASEAFFNAIYKTWTFQLHLFAHSVLLTHIVFSISYETVFFNLNFNCCPFSLPLFLYWGPTVLYKSVTSPLFVKMNLLVALSNPFVNFDALYKIQWYSSFGILMTCRLRKNFYLLDDKTDTGEQFRQVQGS